MTAQDLRLAGAGVAAVSALLFALLAWQMAAGALQPADDAISHAVNALASDTFTAIAHLMSFIGSVAALAAFTLMAVALFWEAGWRDAARRMSGVMAGAFVFGNVLKFVFERARPEPYFGVAPPTYSFPSGHALYAACFFATLVYFIATRRHGPRWERIALWVAGALFALGVGISRIYLGVHFPSDVAAGYLAAGVCLGIGVIVGARDRAERQA